MSSDIPLDDASRRELERLDEILARGLSATELGQYPRGLELAEQAVAHADRIDHSGRRAKALLNKGAVLAKLKRFNESAASLREAARLADASRDDHTRVRALAKLVRVVGYRLAKPDEAEAIAADASAAMARLKHAPLVAAELYNALGTLAKKREDYKQAAQHHAHALTLLTDELGENHTRVAASMNNLGNVMKLAGLRDESVDLFRRARASFERTLGPSHPYVAIAMSNLGNLLLADPQARFFGPNPRSYVEQCRTAEDLVRRAIAIRGSLPGAERRIGRAVHTLGEALRCGGDYGKALEQFERALVIKTIVYEKRPHADLVSTLNGIARCQIGLRDPAAARNTLKRAIAISASTKITHVDRGETLLTLAAAEYGFRTRDSRPKLARQHAIAARGAFLSAGPAYASHVREVDRWLREHPPTASLGGHE
ncbi:MAG: tetratricopeptide repeat protein [Nannocystaceae bacterium]